MTAPSFVAGTEQDGAGLSSGGSVSWAAGGIDDIIVIAYGVYNYTGTNTPSASGFTVAVFDQGGNSSQNEASTGILLKAAGSTSSGSVALNVTNANAGQIDWVTCRITGGDTVNLYDTTAGGSGVSGAGTTSSVGSLTASGVDRLGLIAHFGNSAITTGYSGFANSATIAAFPWEGLWFRAFPSAGATGTFTATHGSDSWGNCFILIPPGTGSSSPVDDVKARQGRNGPGPFSVGPRGPGPFRQTKSGLWYFGSGANPVSTPQTLAVTQTQTPTLAASHAAPRSVAVTQTQTASLTATKQTPTYLTDEFPGSAIDSTKWDVYNRLGDQVNNEVNAVIPANVRVSGGSLFIDSKFEDVSAGDTTTGAPNPRTVHYTSGQVAQHGAPFLYGSVQVRAKLPGGIGLWPCIWMLGYQWQASQPYTANVAGHDWPNGGWWEIDIAEFMFDHRTVVNNALHFISASRTGSGEKALPFNATSRFMVYRLDWTATSLKWLVDAEDGVGWRTLTTMTGTAGVDIPNTPGYLIIHTAVGGNVANTPDSSTFPQTFEVDWARVTPAPGAMVATTLTQTPTIIRSTSKAPAVTLTQTPTLARPATHPRAFAVTHTQTPTAAATRAILRTISATLTQTPTLLRGAARTLTATLTQTPSSTRSIGHPIPTVTQTQTPTSVRSTGHKIPVTLTQTPSSTRSVGKPIAVTQTQTPALVVGRALLRTISATLTQTPVVVRNVGKTAAVTITQTPAAARAGAFARTIAATLTQTPTATKRAGKTLAVTQTQTATQAASRAFLRTIAATLTQTPTVARQTAKSIAATLTQTPSSTRSIGHAVTVTLTQTPQIARTVAKKVTATLTQTPALAASRAFLRALTATQTQTATSSRATGKNVAVTVTQTPSSKRSVGKIVAVTVTQTPALRRGMARTLSAVITQTATLVRRYGRILSAVITQTPTVGASFSDKGQEIPAGSVGTMTTASSTGTMTTASSTGRITP